MLVVDSPYPPYSPVEYVFKGAPSFNLKDSWSDEPENINLNEQKLERIQPRGGNHTAWKVNGCTSREDGKAAYIQWALSSLTEERPEHVRWMKKGEEHRDGDLPADIWFYNQANAVDYTFYKQGMVHRVSCAALLSVADTHENIKSFYLYNQVLEESAFLEVHSIAIQYNVPLWLAFASHMFEIDFGDVDTFHKKYTDLDNLPPEWIARAFGMRFDENGSLTKIKGTLEEPYPFIHYVLPLIQYEKNYAGTETRGL